MAYNLLLLRIKKFVRIYIYKQIKKINHRKRDVFKSRKK